MATFTVEDGTGLTAATSYVSVAAADDYLSLKSNASEWIDLSTGDKQKYLMWATRLLDQRAMFRGNKSVPTSGLRWPRIGVCDRDGISIEYDVIPTPIKAATIEIAFHLVNTDVDPSTPISSSGEIERIKADVIEIEYTKGTQTATVNYFPVGINDILMGLGAISTGYGSRAVRIMRA